MKRTTLVFQLVSAVYIVFIPVIAQAQESKPQASINFAMGARGNGPVKSL